MNIFGIRSEFGKLEKKSKKFCDVSSDPSTDGEYFIFEFRGYQIFCRYY
jgi:hypothetical protein